MVHRREINGETVVFGNQGDLWNNAQTWFDHDTGSVWSQVTGTALLGPLKGTSVELLSSELSSWRDWREQFPDTMALATETSRNTFRIENLTVVAQVNGEVAGIEFGDLRDRESISIELGGEPVIFIAEPNFDRWAVFSRTVQGEVREIEIRNGLLTDINNGDTWAPSTGASFNGFGVLDRIPTFSSNFADFVNIFPEGRVLVQPAVVRQITPGSGSYINVS